MRLRRGARSMPREQAPSAEPIATSIFDVSEDAPSAEDLRGQAAMLHRMRRFARDREGDVRRRLVAAGLEVLRPRPCVRPSVWAKDNITLSPEQTARAGRYDPAVKPWLADVLDVEFDNPTCKGCIIVKPAQVLISTAVLVHMACESVINPRMCLYVIDDRDKSKWFGKKYIDPMVEASPPLLKTWRSGGATGSAKRGDLVQEKTFPGGRLELVGAGTVSGVVSKPFQRVYLDEYERIMDNFPGELQGSAWTMAISRGEATPEYHKVWAFSHPRRDGEGIMKLYDELSDKREWVFDCPHCGKTIAPRWSMVKHESDANGRLITSKSRFCCPHCDRVIHDYERAKAVQPRKTHSGRGGTGRFQSTLSDEEARRRQWVGMRIHRLADPFVQVSELAERFNACILPEDKLGFYTTTLGEPYTASITPLTIEHFKRATEHAVSADEQVSVPLPGEAGAAAGGVLLCTMGVDVQAPINGLLTYVCRVSCFDACGHEFAVRMKVVNGEDALAEFIRTTQIATTRDGKPADPLHIMAVGIDCQGGVFRKVADFCRRTIINKGGHLVKLVPLRYVNFLRGGMVSQLAPERSRTDPTRPHLGAFEHFYELDREAWVDRQMRRMQEGRLIVLCPPPPDLHEHLTSNVRALQRTSQKWEKPRMAWERLRDRRDDWMQAGAFGECVASLVLGLDQLGEYVSVPNVQPQSEQTSRDDAPNWFSNAPNWFGDGDGDR